MPKSTVFLPRLNYGLHATILLLNVIVIGSMTWDVQNQNQIFTDGEGGIGAIAALAATSLALIYTVILLALSLFGIAIPHLARILLDSLLLAPAYVVSAVMLGIWTDWGSLTPDGSPYLCITFLGAACNNLGVTIARLQVVALVFGIITLLVRLGRLDAKLTALQSLDID
ncbi:hypothetical protein C8J56DRAFT_1130990 [Mycena floridula]|nr:hypothetical protein C8J56DRAFT_1130990 [Mycena floridula]